MGFLSGLFSSKTKSSSETKETRKSDVKDTSSTTASINQKENQTSKVQQLDDEVINSLSSVLTGLAGQLTSGGETEAASGLAALLADRAAGADEAFSGFVTNQLSEARRVGERELKSLETNIAQAAGGSRVGNSLVAAATAEGRAGLESQLAGLGAQLFTGARGSATEEITNALGGQSAGLGAQSTAVNALAQLAYALKGAETTSESQATSETLSQEDVLRTILENVTGTSNTTGSTKANDGGFLGKLLLAGVSK